MSILKVLFAIIAITILVLYWYFELSTRPRLIAPKNISFETELLSASPIVSTTISQTLQDESEHYGYANINGPTLIKVPGWVDNPLGKYYLYFAHHKGQFIRMAYSDSLSGPYKLYEENVLDVASSTMSTTEAPASSWKDLRKYTSWSEARAIMQVGQEAKAAYEKRIQQKLKSSPPTTPHIASPEIFIDDIAQTIRLYFHGVIEGNIQMTKVAISKDGLTFKAKPDVIGLPYMRVFEHHDQFYALSMPGILYKSADGLSNYLPRNKWLFDTKVRHSGIYKNGNMLYIYYSRVGESPERILCSSVDISSSNWRDWVATEPIDVLQSELEWEGVNKEMSPSLRGEIGTLVHQLRDPFIYEENEQLYLLYTGGGEQHIGIRKITMKGLN